MGQIMRESEVLVNIKSRDLKPSSYEQCIRDNNSGINSISRAFQSQLIEMNSSDSGYRHDDDVTIPA